MGRSIPVGTSSIEKSEYLADTLIVDIKDISVQNAKKDEEEAEIIFLKKQIRKGIRHFQKLIEGFENLENHIQEVILGIYGTPIIKGGHID